VLRGAMTDTRSEVAEITRALREDLLARVEEQYGGVVDRLAGLADEVTTSTAATRDSGQRLAALSALHDEVRQTLESLQGSVTASTDTLRADLLSRADAQLAELGERFAAVRAAVEQRLDGVESTVRDGVRTLGTSYDERTSALSESVAAGVGELAASLDGGLTRLGGQVDELGATVSASKDSTRQAGERLLALADLVRAQRAELDERLDLVRDDVVEAARDLRKELLTKTSTQVAELLERMTELDVTVDERSADVAERLAALDSTVARAATASDQVAEGLGELDETSATLQETVEGFRAEWPTRTFEVVQGAKAVAEGVVREVRAEVETQLEQVREELARAVDEVEVARDGLHSGTDRLSRAGKVLVAYLEQRDRLLEAERDRVLHDVLDSFAAGLSARDRAALASRVSDVVARRRDARDAERYRAAVGEPTPPTVDLPEEVEQVVPDDAATAAARREAPARRSQPPRRPEPPSPERGALSAPVGPAKRPPQAVTAAPAQGLPAKAVTAAPSPASAAAGKAPAKGTAAKATPGKRAPAKATPAKTTAKATPAKTTGGRAPAKASGRPPGKATGKSTPAKASPRSDAATRTSTTPEEDRAEPPGQPRGERRGRLEAMPEVPSVQVALDAAVEGTRRPRAEEPASAPDLAEETTEPAKGESAQAEPAKGEPVDRAPTTAGPSAPRTQRPARPEPAPETSWASRPTAPPPVPDEGDEDEDEDEVSMRRLFRRHRP
jgi:hypothetical protein